ncbi:MAG: glycosyl transferase [Hyphomicrobiales bacterium]|nr:MAG: glycosyl transferase [Hyphomicrobiales bacterium]
MRRAGDFNKTQEDFEVPKGTLSNEHSATQIYHNRAAVTYRDLVKASLNARENSLSKQHRDRIETIHRNTRRLKNLANHAFRTNHFKSQRSRAVERKAAFETNRKTHLARAINALHELFPHLSSKRTFTPTQALFFSTLIATLLGGWISGIPYFSNAVLIFLSIFYLASVLCRLALLSGYEAKMVGPTTRELENIRQDTLPSYSVVVALHQEAGQVSDLCFHLSKLNWPKDRLEIKLICEADDTETIEAIRKLKLPDYFDLIAVPYAEPRTKPKALNYALPLCTGKYLVLYDAEDQPDPYQLLEAYYKFQNGDPALVCLQAPLHIHNNSQTWLTRMFCLEYCTQFEGILPLLERWNVPIPLGGTSNHFKLAELKKLGAWDPFNVTEDADLGIRIYRAGYQCGTITHPTHEEAPPIFSVWLPQRTRWMKGWMQTILVHSRSPALIVKQMGWKSFLMFHLLITSVVLSSLLHPFFLFITIVQLLGYGGETLSILDAISRMSMVFVLIGGYLAYGLLAFLVLGHNKLTHFRVYLFTLPLYWLLLSTAGWRAAGQLLLNPHKWEKTRHGLANQPINTTLTEGVTAPLRQQKSSN